MANYDQVKDYLFELGYKIISEDKSNEIVVIDDQANGINNLIIDCEAPILILEQFLFEIKNEKQETYMRLLQLGREIVHGAFVLDESGKKVLFRDTLQLENLDLNELEGSINSLRIAMAEYSNELIKMAN